MPASLIVMVGRVNLRSTPSAGDLLLGEVHGLPLGEESRIRGSNPGVAHPNGILEVRADLFEHLLVELDVFVDLPDPPSRIGAPASIRREPGALYSARGDLTPDLGRVTADPSPRHARGPRPAHDDDFDTLLGNSWQVDEDANELVCALRTWRRDDDTNI
jgi:hypothetical protein